MKINRKQDAITKSPVFSGLFCLLVALLIPACNSQQTPDQVSRLFWTLLSQNNITAARQYTTEESYSLISDNNSLDLGYSSLEFGETRINGQVASVETRFIYPLDISQKPDLQFKTYLSKENEIWKIDYQKTMLGIPGKALGDLFKTLENLGKVFSDQLKQQVPIIEQQIEELNQLLNQKIEEFNRQLKESMPPQQQDPYEDTI